MYSLFQKRDTHTHAHPHGMRFIISRPAGDNNIFDKKNLNLILLKLQAIYSLAK